MMKDKKWMLQPNLNFSFNLIQFPKYCESKRTSFSPFCDIAFPNSFEYLTANDNLIVAKPPHYAAATPRHYPVASMQRPGWPS